MMNNLGRGTLLQNGKFEIVKTLGSGGFGITYLAIQRGLEREVVIKEFFMKEFYERSVDSNRITVGTEASQDIVNRFKEKFLKEARNLAKLNHPYIIRVFDVFEENDTAYYVMEYAANGSLAEKIKRDGPLSEADATRYILKVADALDYIHQRKLNHLDVKPANIVLNEKDEPILIDFGLSKQYDDVSGNQTSTTPVGISEGYAPMEQYKQGGVGQFSPETDIYALGATFFKLLTGVTPPSAMELFEERLPIDELKSRGVSQNVIDVICKAMESRKKDRFTSVMDFTFKLINFDFNSFNDIFKSRGTQSSSGAPDDEATATLNSGIDNNRASRQKKIVSQQSDEETTFGNLTESTTEIREAKGKSFLIGLLVVLVMAIGIPVAVQNSGRVYLYENETISELNYSQYGGVSSIPVKGKSAVELIRNGYLQGIPDWCHIDASDEYILTLLCEQNEDSEDRTATILVGDKLSKSAKLIIRQSGSSIQSSNENNKTHNVASNKTSSLSKTELSELSKSENKPMTISQVYANLKLGEKLQLKATYYGDYLSWESGDPSVATVNSDGVVTTVGIGEAYIWAKGQRANLCCLVTVTGQHVSTSGGSTNYYSSTSSMTISKSSLELKLGESSTLSCQNYGSYLRWESDNSHVAKVSANGTVTAVGIGKTNIWAYGADNQHKLCKVTVYGSPSSMTISKSSLTLKLGESSILSCQNYGSYLEWESDNPRVAKVSINGTVTAVGIGNTNIWAYGDNNQHKLCKVTVE